MKKRIYLAYGSNLNEEQMNDRCTDAVMIGLTEIKDYELLFKKSRTGYYATIEPKKGGTVPTLVWEISEADEQSLDFYEGFPAQYQKEELNVEVNCFKTGDSLGTRTGLVYLLPVERKLGQPTELYYQKLKRGYERFGFNLDILEQAVKNSSREKSE